MPDKSLRRTKGTKGTERTKVPDWTCAAFRKNGPWWWCGRQCRRLLAADCHSKKAEKPRNAAYCRVKILVHWGGQERGCLGNGMFAVRMGFRRFGNRRYSPRITWQGFGNLRYIAAVRGLRNSLSSVCGVVGSKKYCKGAGKADKLRQTWFKRLLSAGQLASPRPFAIHT